MPAERPRGQMMDLMITGSELIVPENFDPLLVDDEILCQALLYEFGLEDCAPLYAER